MIMGKGLNLDWLKKWRRRYRVWKQKPMRYSNKQQEPVHCANCGYVFADNYCPRCGQRAGVGRIGWHTVRENIMMLWGVESNTMLYTLWQLLCRPGYLINDYINGKQKVSFPPVKMLFIVAIVLLLLEKVFPEAKAADVSVTTGGEELVLMKYFSQWFENNPGMGMMLLNIFFLIPTWVLFRHSPRNNRHSLPQGFFIQVFMSVIIMMMSCLGAIVGNKVEWFTPLFYVITFRQLFGYSLWGTIWRVVFCFIQTFFLLIITIVIFDMIMGKTINRNSTMKEMVVGVLVIIGINVLLVVIFDIIGYYTEKRRQKKV